MIDYFETEVLIIGCGIAGGVAALQLADAGVPVTVVTRAPEPHESNTYYAQGGIIYQGLHDSAKLLAEDIMRAGAGHCYADSVKILAEQGPALVREILFNRVGVPFDLKNGGALSLAREGGHSLPRIIHATDATGRAIAVALLAALASHPQVTLLTGYTAVDLLRSDRHSHNRLAVYEPPVCLGAALLDQAGGQVRYCLAKNTVVATGGLGQIFRRTTNPAGARGDGMAMAYRAGARVINMEFVQFHPTAFYHPEAFPFLISEAVRGAGARLVDARGEPFMPKYDPQWQDLAPRDVVARSIHQEMMAQDVPNVYLDIGSYLPVQDIRARFPTIYEHCRAYGIDITHDLVPVVPAAHYACGGIWVDAWGQTTVEGLYAVGEAACTGLHGANRLASTSLLEGLVWGYRAAQHIQPRLRDQARLNPAAVLADEEAELPWPNSARLVQMMDRIKRLMWDYVGLVRTTPGLQQALPELRQLQAEVEHLYQSHQLTDELIGLRNATQTALLVTIAALENKNCLGCHYRAPEVRENKLFWWEYTHSVEPILAA
jgi:L-aspartate oxidase